MQLDTIDISFPVNLSPEQPGDLEILFGKVNDVDKMTLPEVANACRKVSEKVRRVGNSELTKKADRLGRYLPDSLLSLGMNQGWELFKRVNFSKLGISHHPFGSTTISNIGAIRRIDGLTGLSTMALIIPMGYTSSYLLGPTVDRPVVEDRAIVAKPVASLTYGIDHRVLDGFGFVRYVDFWTQCFRNPERYLMTQEMPSD